jgi:hypothetical protein
MPPCGVPVLVSCKAWASDDSVRIPALQNAFTKPSTRRSPMRRRTRPIRAVWSMQSKHASISASSTHS